MSDKLSIQFCPVCEVKIQNGSEVLFSHGKPGTRERLYARVCKYAKDKDNCINNNEDILKPLCGEDFYHLPPGM